MAFWNKNKETKKETPLREGPASLSKVKQIIAIASGKGGVGKSTLTANLAVALASKGAKVALMDADIYGASQPGMFGAASGGDQLIVKDNMLVPITRHGISFVSMGLLMGDDAPVVWRAPMVIKLLQQFIGQVAWGELDYLLIDLPPGTGDIQLTLAQRASLDGAVIITTPQQVAVGIAQKGMRMFEQVKVPILGVIENMSGFTCGKCGERTDIFDQGGGAQMAEDSNVPFLGAIPIDKAITKSGDEGIPVLIDNPDAPAAKSFLALAEAIQTQIAGATADPKRPVSTNLNEDGSFEITWADGHESRYTSYPLRMACGCALCVDENTGRRTLNPDRVPLDIKVTGFTNTGRYAITFTFSDGHSTGIYTLDKLRDNLCECKVCNGASEPESFSV